MQASHAGEGTGTPRLAIWARLGPLPPRTAFMSLVPSSERYPSESTPTALARVPDGQRAVQRIELRRGHFPTRVPCCGRRVLHRRQRRRCGRTPVPGAACKQSQLRERQRVRVPAQAKDATHESNQRVGGECNVLRRGAAARATRPRSWRLTIRRARPNRPAHVSGYGPPLQPLAAWTPSIYAFCQ